MKKSVIIALVILFGLIAYFAVRMGLRGDDGDTGQITGKQTVLELEADQNTDLPRVVVETVSAEPHPVFLTLKGRTEPNRMVTVRAATTGTVVGAPDLEGKFVRKGALLCRLDVEARQARIDEAEARLNAEQVDFDAAQTLVEKGWAAPTRANAAKAARDAAQASVNAARVELQRTRLTAPFAGVFETRLAEAGDFLSPGSPCGVVAELDPIRVVAEVTEDYATALTSGAPVRANVLSAGSVEGTISYVARTADENTRTFKVEAVIDNADGRISAGLTSDLRIKLGDADKFTLKIGRADHSARRRSPHGDHTVRFGAAFKRQEDWMRLGGDGFDHHARQICVLIRFHFQHGLLADDLARIAIVAAQPHPHGKIGNQSEQDDERDDDRFFHEGLFLRLQLDIAYNEL